MIIEDVIVSSELGSEMFTCDIARCKGACCVEGELGAPLEREERQILEEIYPVVEPYLREEGKRTIAEQGHWVLDFTGEYSTPLVEGKECAYAVFDDTGIAHCGIEQAFEDGAIDFKKPISCHLYPIRVTKSRKMEAMNYDRWDICSPACQKGKVEGVKVYEFTKAAIVRKYGEDFYQAMDELFKLVEEGEKA